MVKPIIQIGDKILITKSKSIPVDKIASKEMLTLYSDLLDTAKLGEDNSVGLSAVQIGELWRVCICRRIDLEDNGEAEKRAEWEIMINPTIRIIDSTDNLMWEGCLSIGKSDDQLFGPVSRPETIEVTYLNEKGEQKSITASGYFSHVIQHEVDHMDGVLFINYIENPQNIWRSIDLDDYIKEYGAYPDIV